jgi:hypothetical protein
LFGVSDETISKAAVTLNWMHGGIIFYPRRFMERNEAWMRKATAFGCLSPCDETPMFISEFIGELVVHDLRRRKDLSDAHIIGPAALSFRSNMYKPVDFVHYAGDHYREHNEINKNIIYSELRYVKQQLKLKL